MSVAGNATVLRHRHGFTPLYSLTGRPYEVWDGQGYQTVRVVRCAHPERLLTFFFSNGLTIDVPKRAEMTIVNEDTGAITVVLAGNVQIGARLAPFTDQDDQTVDVFVSAIKDRSVNEEPYEVAGPRPIPFQVFLQSQVIPQLPGPSPL